MASPSAYPVSPAWLLIMRDIGIHPADVLRRAGVAADLLAREHATVRGDEFCRLLWALDAEVRDRTLPIRIAQALSFEMFDPPVFAAMCSPDLDTALHRLAHYKRLCAPVALQLTVGPESTRVRPVWSDPPSEPPPLLYAMELAYCVKLARLGTREHVVPRAVFSTIPLEPADAYHAYFGVALERGDEMAVEFAAADARRPFLTARAGMWSFFEPELRRRLAEIDAQATTTMRTRAALLELLPSGRASVQAVASCLGVSARTLQRRLMEEDTTFQRVLDATREELARHYLGTTAMAGAEISFLLGFEDPSSFVRAFHDWTGKTPEQVRSQLRRQEA
ncbi:MAG: AraC family transcriptional regulator [Deltaproteobacteria bacterium]|nr:AraC family transcriptional regulator [Kofleriaceae bacterium]